MMLDNTVTLMAVGDIMLGDHPICIGHGVGSRIKINGSEFIFKKVSKLLNTADITFGNLEVVLSDLEINPADLKSVQLRGSENSVNGLVSAGFDVMSIANNHILEHGKTSMVRTQNILSSNGIMVVGDSSRGPVILNRNGISFGFLAYCLVRDKTAYCSVEDSNTIINDIKKFKDYSDVLIVSLHWGNEYIRKPSHEQVSLAHRMIDAGADLILGHHPHVLQGVERYNNGIIVYSMGNFVFDMWQHKMRESMIFLCRFTKHGIKTFKIIPIFINNFYQPCILHGIDADQLLLKIGDEFLERTSDNEYQKEVQNCRNEYRLDLIKHILISFYMYDSRYLFSILIQTIQKILLGGKK